MIKPSTWFFFAVDKKFFGLFEKTILEYVIKRKGVSLYFFFISFTNLKHVDGVTPLANAFRDAA
jgi:hypothetical protein